MSKNFPTIYVSWKTLSILIWCVPTSKLRTKMYIYIYNKNWYGHIEIEVDFFYLL